MAPTADQDGRAHQGAERKKPNWWRRLGRLAVELTVIGLVFWAVGAWQSRDLLDEGEPAPRFELQLLDGGQRVIGGPASRPTVLYFFAPWCSVCDAVAGQVARLHDRGEPGDAEVVAVALSWDNPTSVQEAVRDHGLGDVPVLLGGSDVLRAYQIAAFPTFYILAPDGSVHARTQGFTTAPGIRLRLP